MPMAMTMKGKSYGFEECSGQQFPKLTSKDKASVSEPIVLGTVQAINSRVEMLLAPGSFRDCGERGSPSRDHVPVNSDAMPKHAAHRKSRTSKQENSS